jgi:hypothetical protein
MNSRPSRMKKSRASVFTSLVLLLSGVLHAEDGKIEKAKEVVKETAQDVTDATKKAAVATKEKSVELYDQAAVATKHAADVTAEKSKEAYNVTKETTLKAKDKTVEVSKVVAEKTVETSKVVAGKTVEAGKVVAEKTKAAVEATKEKAFEWTTSKEEFALYDTNKDGHLDANERAAMKAAKEKEKPVEPK